jgi:hypothetical protein
MHTMRVEEFGTVNCIAHLIPPTIAISLPMTFTPGSDQVKIRSHVVLPSLEYCHERDSNILIVVQKSSVQVGGVPTSPFVTQTIVKFDYFEWQRQNMRWGE